MNDLNILKQIILVALKNFLHKDNLLLELGVREEAVSHRVAFYLEQAFEQKKYDLSFDSETIESLVVDCEYDKHRDTKKILNGLIGKYPRKTTEEVRPDIVLHKRNSDINLVVIEIKKKKSDNKQYAKDKVLAFVESSYKYKLGIYIEFNTGINYKVISEPIAVIATFSDGDYKNPNQKLLDMLNTLGKDNLNKKGGFLKYLSKEEENILIQHFDLHEAPENIEVRDTRDYWLGGWLDSITQEKAEKIFKRKLMF